MIFSSAVFIVFLGVLLAIIAMVRNEMHRRVIIFAASFVFYGWWDWRFCFFLIGASTVDYYLALSIQNASSRAIKRRSRCRCVRTSAYSRSSNTPVGSLAT